MNCDDQFLQASQSDCTIERVTVPKGFKRSDIYSSETLCVVSRTTKNAQLSNTCRLEAIRHLTAGDTVVKNLLIWRGMQSSPFQKQNVTKSRDPPDKTSRKQRIGKIVKYLILREV